LEELLTAFASYQQVGRLDNPPLKLSQSQQLSILINKVINNLSTGYQHSYQQSLLITYCLNGKAQEFPPEPSLFETP
jgi:hypothetical protein